MKSTIVPMLQPYTVHALLIHNIEFSATTDHHLAHGYNQQQAETHVGPMANRE